MHFHTYREFYPKALIKMGEKDQSVINNSHSNLTHWLVSLEGYPEQETESYLWEVSIYPSDCEGTFNWNTPLYRSCFYENFDDAYNEAFLLEKTCQLPELSILDYIETKIH